MRVLIYINEICYQYQFRILKKILNIKEIDVQVYLCNFSLKNFEESIVLRKIDAKFPLYNYLPIEIVNLKNQNIVDTNKNGNQFDFVVNLTDSDAINLTEINYKKILKPNIDIEQWEFSTINSSPKTNISLLSSTDNQNWSFFKSIDFFTEKGIYNNRDKALYYFQYIFKNFDSQGANDKNVEKNKRQVSNWKLVKYYANLLVEIVKRKLTTSQLNWKLAILDHNKINLLTHTKGDYWADPFIIINEKEKFVFFEEIEKLTKKGIISLLKLNPQNEIIDKKEVLNLPFHMSFPNVFRHNEDYYMLPEQIESNQLVLYKAKEFPYGWEINQVIFRNTKAVDPAIIFYDNRYYLFTNIVEDYEYDNNERMSIFYTEDLLSKDWQSHPQNPIKIDKSGTRNAGKIYINNGEIFRIAQNCNPTYGFSTTKLKITKLTPTEFEEKEIEHFKLNDYQGNHTLNKEENLTLIDILVKE